MKFGIHAGLWMKTWEDDLTPIFATVAEIGFDGVEVSLLGIGRDRAKAIRGQAEQCGLELTCSTGLGPEADPTSADPEVRKNAVSVLTEAIEVTALLGAKGLAGVVAAPWGAFDPLNKTTRAERSAQTLGQLDGILAEQGVTLGIEALNRFETDLNLDGSRSVRACAVDGIKTHRCIAR